MRIKAYSSSAIVALTATAFLLFAPPIFGQSNEGAGTSRSSRIFKGPGGDANKFGGSMGSPTSENPGSPQNGNIGPPPGNVGPPPGNIGPPPGNIGPPPGNIGPPPGNIPVQPGNIGPAPGNIGPPPGAIDPPRTQPAISVPKIPSASTLAPMPVPNGLILSSPV